MQHLWRRCAAAFALAAFGETSQAQDYYPKPESQGGWRALVEPNATPSAEQKAFVRQVTGLDWDRLEDAWQVVAPHGGELLVIRAGWIAGEWGPGQTYHVASCTKSLTALAMARLFDLSESGELSVAIEPSSAARDFLPAAWGAKPGAGAIELRHLMTMSSGLAAHDAPAPNGSYAEVVLDQPIAAPPNTVWAYSSASVDLLSYAVEGATGDTLAAFFAEEIAAPLGMKPFVWQSMGEHTVASAYAYLAPRELARVGYLMLREGRWGAGPAWQQVVSAERITAMTTWAEELGSTTFQEPSFFTNDPESHLRYGELVWTNHVENGFVGQHLPADAWYMASYATNLCLVVPSLDLVVVRLGKGPKPWDDALVAAFGDAIAEAVVSDPLPYASASPMGPSCGGPSLASSS